MCVDSRICEAVLRFARTFVQISHSDRKFVLACGETVRESVFAEGIFLLIESLLRDSGEFIRTKHLLYFKTRYLS